MALTQTQQQQLAAVINWMNEVIANSKRTDELDPMPTPIDRDALLRLALGSTSYYLSLEDLVDDIASELVLGNVPAKFRQVTIDFAAPGTTVSKVIAAVNSGTNYPLEQGTMYFFYTNRLVLTNGIGLTTGEPGSPTYAVVSEYFVLTQRIVPDGDGIASVGTGGTTISSIGLRYFMTIDSRSFAPTEFDLGDIGSDDIWTAVNASGPYSTPNAATILFRAEQGGTNKLWLYIGINEEIGTGHPSVGSSDFRLFPDEDNLDPPPQYQETLPQESSATLPTEVPLYNHEGINLFFGTSGNSSIDDFTTSNRLLGGKAYLYLNTTGRSDFPTIDGGSSVLLSGDPFIVDSNYICEIFYNGSEVMHRFKKVGQVPTSAGGANYIGGYNANTNTPDLDTSPSGISRGDMYTVTAAGAFFTEEVEAGDFLIAEQDDPTTLSHWTVIQKNLDASEFLLRDGSVPMTGPLALKYESVASATTINLSGKGNLIVVTGTTTITGFTGVTNVGQLVVVQFDDSLSLTHSGSFSLLGDENIDVNMGDVALFVYQGGSQWRMWMLQRFNGNPLNNLPNTVSDAGTNIDLQMGIGRLANMSSANSNQNLTFNLPKAGAWDQWLINLAAEHNITSGYTISAGSFVIGKEYTIDTVGTTDFTAIGAASNTVGVVFTATGVGSGTGTATENAIKISGDAFIASTDMYLFVWYNGNRVEYWYKKI